MAAVFLWLLWQQDIEQKIIFQFLKESANKVVPVSSKGNTTFLPTPYALGHIKQTFDNFQRVAFYVLMLCFALLEWRGRRNDVR